MIAFPKRIKFLADSNEAVLVKEEKTKSGNVVVGYYGYVKSETKLGREMPMELDDIIRLKSYGLLEVMEA